MKTLFPQRLKELRLEKELTQPAVAKIMHVTYNTICHWENGRSSPNLEELCQLADFFETTADYLLGRTDIG
ncbi:MAG: helix-turn-helix domain-containing protein [Firmicutes bacterium]|nr:helix-turn-helix domain-containing protein [Bacillota bacterium]